MEFKCLTNIETSFRQLRMYALVFAGVCAVVTVAALDVMSAKVERDMRNEINRKVNCDTANADYA